MPWSCYTVTQLSTCRCTDISHCLMTFAHSGENAVSRCATMFNRDTE